MSRSIVSVNCSRKREEATQLNATQLQRTSPTRHHILRNLHSLKLRLHEAEHSREVV